MKITSNDLLKFHRQYYYPNNAILTIVGDLTQAEAVKIVEEFFSSWKPGELPPPPPRLPRLSQPTVAKIDKDITQANIINWHKSTNPIFMLSNNELHFRWRWFFLPADG
jgi:predicted Zn-dependent peptidase